MNSADPALRPAPRWLRALHRIEDAVLAALLAALVLIAAAQILLRNLFDTGLLWADPAARVLVMWVALLGALVATRENKQISIDVLPRLLAGRSLAVTRALTSLITAFICAVLAYHGARFVLFEFEGGMVGVAQIPSWLLATVIPVTFGLMSVRYLGFGIVYAQRALGPPTP